MKVDVLKSTIECSKTLSTIEKKRDWEREREREREGERVRGGMGGGGERERDRGGGGGERNIYTKRLSKQTTSGCTDHLQALITFWKSVYLRSLFATTHWASCLLFLIWAPTASEYTGEHGGPSWSISHKISKSDSSGGELVICDSAQHTTWVASPPPTPTTNNTPTLCPQQTTQSLSTWIKRKNLKKNNLVKKLKCIKLIMGGWVGITRFTLCDYREWSETTCTLAYIRRHVSSAWQPVS